MDTTLARFVSALRKSELNVSPAETLDGFAVVQRVGIQSPALLRDALSLTLAKDLDEKHRFDTCFDRFFNHLAVHHPVKQSFFRELDRTLALQELRARLGTGAYASVAAVFHDQHDALSMRLYAAGQEAGIDTIKTLREKSTFASTIAAHLGIPDRTVVARYRKADGEAPCTKSERLKEIAVRAGRVLWLNPEDPDSWGTGDSEMRRYAPYCFQVSRCNSLQDLARFADRLVVAQR